MKKLSLYDKIRQSAGLLLIVAGALTLALTRIAAWSNSNALLLTGLLLVVAGIGAHIWTIKRESRY